MRKMSVDLVGFVYFEHIQVTNPVFLLESLNRYLVDILA